MSNLKVVISGDDKRAKRAWGRLFYEVDRLTKINQKTPKNVKAPLK